MARNVGSQVTGLKSILKNDQFWWWASLIVIIVIAGLLRYTGYNFSYPYLEHLDEPALNVAANFALRLGTAAQMNAFNTYPPGAITLYYLLLRWFHDPAEFPFTVIPMVRLIAITASLGSITIVALMGRQIGSPLGGLIAAGQMAVFEQLVEENRFGTADPFVTFFALFAFYLVLQSISRKSNRLAFLSTLFLCLAILFKYQAIFIMPVLFAGLAWRWLLNSDNEKPELIRGFFDSSLAIAVFLFWLLAIYPALDSGGMGGYAASVDRLQNPFHSLTGNLMATLSSSAPIQSWTWLAEIGLLGLLLLILPHRRKMINLPFLILSFLTALLWLGGISVFGSQGLRQFLAVQALVSLASGIGLALIIEAVSERISRIRPEMGIQIGRYVQVGCIIGLIGMGLPEFRYSIDNAYQHTLHDRRVDFAIWADMALDAGKYISDAPNHKTFNPSWGGYSGTTELPLYELALVTDHPLSEWREANVEYAILSNPNYQSFLGSPDAKKYLAGMVRLKEYPASPNYRDPGMALFRIYPMQHRVEGQLGPIHLLGYDIDTTQVKAGEPFTVRYYFRADHAPDADYFVFNHLVPEGDIQPSAQFDGPPLLRRSTTLWDDPMEIIYSRAYTISVGADVAPGVYHLLMGFYRLDTGERLLAPNNDSFLKVLTIRVSKP